VDDGERSSYEEKTESGEVVKKTEKVSAGNSKKGILSGMYLCRY